MSTDRQADPVDAAANDRERGGLPGPGEADPRHDDRLAELDVEETFERTLDEGRRRLSRHWPALLSTGFVGGVDVGTGVLALLLVERETGSSLLGGVAFSVGFVALALARSELFTEGFLVPVTTVVARQARVRSLLRLWGGTLVMNLVGGWVVTGLIVQGFPSLRRTAVEAGAFYVNLGLGWRAFALALLGGLAITLMTWMQHSSESLGLKTVPAVTTAFLLGAGQLNHAIVNSLLMFAALHTGAAPFGYLDWLLTAGWAALGNVVGGLVLVTLLRLLQVEHKVREQARRPASGVATGGSQLLRRLR